VTCCADSRTDWTCAAAPLLGGCVLSSLSSSLRGWNGRRIAEAERALWQSVWEREKEAVELLEYVYSQYRCVRCIAGRVSHTCVVACAVVARVTRVKRSANFPCRWEEEWGSNQAACRALVACAIFLCHHRFRAHAWEVFSDMRRKAIKIQSFARQIATRERVRYLFTYERFMEVIPLMLVTPRAVFDRRLLKAVNNRRHNMLRAASKGTRNASAVRKLVHGHALAH